MERLGFHQTWIRWLMQCIKTVSYSFLINDQAKGLVTPQRGIRQGDPLSPYIFIICSEVLSGLCLKAQREGNLIGVKVAKGSPRVNHLLFADDTMFFIRADQHSCLTLKNILHKYEAASGQKINQSKSSITFSAKTPMYMRTQAKDVLEIQKEGGQGKYLGLPELFGRKKKDLFTSIVDRIKQKALSWSSRFLSTAGKLTMLKSVLSAMPTYTMSCFHLPGLLCKRIQSALTRFWWDTNTEKKKMSWIAWRKITKPTKFGGLGIRDIKHFNKALLAKLSWRLLTKPHTLLARVLLGKYCKNLSLLDCKIPSSASHGWRSIGMGRDLLKSKLGRVIGSGANTPIWRTPWLSTSSPLAPIGPPTEASQHLNVADLLLPNSRGWNVDLIKHILPAFEQDILLLKPSFQGAEDIWAWLPTKDGCYTAKSGYFESTNHEPEPPVTNPIIPSSELQFDWQRNIWALKTSPKTKLLLWKASQNALPVGANLLHRAISESAKCPYCDEEETITHLFFHCAFARKIWELLPVKTSIQLNDVTSIRQGIEVSNRLICLPPTGVGTGPISPWLLWSIWSSRNQLIFSKRRISEDETLQIALVRAKEWQNAQVSCVRPDPPQKSHLNPPNPRPNLICFTDAAWRNDVAGLGWVFKGPNDLVIKEGSASMNHVSSPLMAEALETLTAIRVALESNITELSFASDSLMLVQALNKKIQLKELHGTLHDVLDLSSNFTSCSFNFISRSQNQQADCLAKEALSLFMNL
ncbi:PREDICTED: uncharacterized protein LOC104744076 [Camelina sativa]|uniref:Uncharacterized protein LOC104744076 n=1 Tax=Camelina sativa TaxID=90675 RepID=A0ABM0VZ26_CAMSA|nr:PREDICTED: uncharacterized protein LOC104744076 [Camelina sativa]